MPLRTHYSFLQKFKVTGYISVFIAPYQSPVDTIGATLLLKAYVDKAAVEDTARIKKQNYYVFSPLIIVHAAVTFQKKIMITD